ncbi:MAG: hypothetical protein AB7F86_12670 [Bdellovibrionales bacterium]
MTLSRQESKWSFYLDQIRSGKSEYLKAWPDMKKAADAGIAQELDLVLSELLSRNPGLVFLTIERGWKGSGRDKALERVCSISGNEFADIPGVSDQDASKRPYESVSLRIKEIGKLEGNILGLNRCASQS